MSSETQRPIQHEWFSGLVRLGGWILSALFLVAWAGCSRGHYRRQADAEVYSLVHRGSCDPRWPMDDYTIQPSPQSRLYDANPADCPPMPWDDPTSHELMRCVDGKQGWSHWHDHGDATSVDNDSWRGYLRVDADGTIVLDREGAVEVALLHSRDYQRQLETLYLSALDVTFERFRFDAQFFGGNSTFFTSDGPLRSGANRLTSDTDLQMRRLMAGGGELVVGMANSLVWQFAGPDTFGTNTLLDFSLVQPLLRAGGRAVVLERLTDSERALLANIRQMERFRRGFYTQVLAGQNPGPGPSRGGIGIGSPPGGGGGVGGYLFFLQEQIRIRNRRETVATLEDNLARLQLRADLDPTAGTDASLGVDNALQSLLDGQADLISRTSAYESRLDAYKISLGLPPNLDVRIEDPYLERFDLIDPELSRTQDDVERTLRPLRGVLDRCRDVRQMALLASESSTAATAAAAANAAATAADVAAADATTAAAAALTAADVAAADAATADAAAAEAAAGQSRLKVIAEVRRVAEKADEIATIGRHMEANPAAVAEIVRLADLTSAAASAAEQAAADAAPTTPAGGVIDPNADPNAPPAPAAAPPTPQELAARAALIDRALAAAEQAAKAADALATAGAADFHGDAPAVMAGVADELGPIGLKVTAHLQEVAEDCRLLDLALPGRRRDLQALVAREELRRGEVEPEIADVDAMDRRVVELHVELYGSKDPQVRQRADTMLLRPADRQWFAELIDRAGLANNLPVALEALDQFHQGAAEAIAGAGSDLQAWSTLIEWVRNRLEEDLAKDLLALSLLQAKTRLETSTLTPIDLDPAEALELARANRRDWMNARAALVDVWRQIELAANDLESDLDIVFSGDINTLHDNPVSFNSATGRLRVGLQFDAPLTRLAQRNAYRSVLIAYQQARREYYAYEDRVDLILRDALREARLNQLNFEIRRQAVLVAARRVDLAQREISKPVKVGGGSQAATVASRNIVDALNGLLSAQDRFLGVWVEYEVQRMNLNLDLGTMRLDDRGMWIDPGPITSDTGAEAVLDLAPPEQLVPPQAYVPSPGAIPVTFAPPPLPVEPPE